MAIVDITKIRLFRGPSADLPTQLEDAQLAFTTDDGRLFVGFSGDTEIVARDVYPYANLEILSENSIELFGNLHGNRMKEGGGSDYYSAVLNQSGKNWQAVHVLRDGTWFNYTIGEIDNVTAFMDYVVYTNDGETIRGGHSTLRHYDSNEAEPFFEDHMTAGRDLAALLQLEPNEVFKRVDLRFRVAGPLNAPYLLFEYRNPLGEAVNLRFKVSRPKVRYHDYTTDKELISRINVLVRIIPTMVGTIGRGGSLGKQITVDFNANGMIFITGAIASQIYFEHNADGHTIPSGSIANSIIINTGAVGSVIGQTLLTPLSLSNSSYMIGTPASGTIIGSTSGSTITSGALPSGFTIDGFARTWAWNGTGTASDPLISLVQTLAGTIGSPSNNLIQLSIIGGAP